MHITPSKEKTPPPPPLPPAQRNRLITVENHDGCGPSGQQRLCTQSQQRPRPHARLQQSNHQRETHGLSHSPPPSPSSRSTTRETPKTYKHKIPLLDSIYDRFISLRERERERDFCVRKPHTTVTGRRHGAGGRQKMKIQPSCRPHTTPSKNSPKHASAPWTPATATRRGRLETPYTVGNRATYILLLAE